MELTTQDVSHYSHSASASTSSNNTDVGDMSELNNEPNTSFNQGGIILVEKLDNTNGSETNASENNVCLISVVDATGRKKSQHIIETNDAIDKAHDNMDGHMEMDSESAESFATLNQNNNNNFDLHENIEPAMEEIGENVANEESIEIRIVKNASGEYMIESDTLGPTERVPYNVQENMDRNEETMYNLQMLGEVALQDKYRDDKSGDA